MRTEKGGQRKQKSITQHSWNHWTGEGPCEDVKTEGKDNREHGKTLFEYR